MSPSLSEIGANSTMAAYGFTDRPNLINDSEDSGAWALNQERTEIAELLKDRHAARGPGRAFDIVLGFIGLVTTGWMVFAYSHSDSTAAPVYRNLVLVGAIFCAVGVAVRINECNSNRRAAGADRIEAYRHRRLLETIRGADVAGTSPERQRDWTEFAELFERRAKVVPIDRLSSPRSGNGGA
ncbi:hypothetical protein AB0B94_31295 [Micromonospora sp. NPDC048986]|uniref:hypothetical protein n=1 Tax=Micromonospora sp. NPDC048986 TaxID=3155644 RepID=UPI0033C3ED6B